MCYHIHNFQQTPIENLQVCKGCGWKLHIKQVKSFSFAIKPFPETPIILTEDVWGKFKEEFYRVCEDINKRSNQSHVWYNLGLDEKGGLSARSMEKKKRDL